MPLPEKSQNEMNQVANIVAAISQCISAVQPCVNSMQADGDGVGNTAAADVAVLQAMQAKYQSMLQIASDFLNQS